MIFFCFAMVNPSLQALAIVHFGNDLVHCDQQDDVDNGVEQTDCRGEAVIAVQQALFINVRCNDLGSVQVQVSLQGIGLFKNRCS